ncbi:hypothetical protein OPV22_017726 [Ensete ventricosum]|uniref:Uncharacterized protein n=1 Tax=Ensete ventricosum TaxID=4639 RepID=A0AAV8PI21_ENSVE|nr:hypothetical protein OPV22_017726 [Ensete ventricosum]
MMMATRPKQQQVFRREEEELGVERRAMAKSESTHRSYLSFHMDESGIDEEVRGRPVEEPALDSAVVLQHCPPAMLYVPGEPSLVPNPTCKLWLCQDWLILQAIQAFVDRSIAPLVSSYTTTVEAWTKLQTTLVNRSRTRMLGLLSSLMNFKQEGSTVADYLQYIQMIINDLALIGHSLTDEEVLIHMLNGLSAKFKELIAALRARDSLISFEELYDKLIEYEVYLKCDDRLLGSLPGPPIIAQFNQKSKRLNHKYNKTASKGVVNFPPTSTSITPSLPPSHPPYFNHRQSASFQPCCPPSTF